MGLSLATFFTLSTPAQQAKRITHEKALSIMKSCHSKSFSICNEDTGMKVIRRYWSGDRVLLKPLLDAHKVSDGALSEELTVFYGDVLEKRTETFLAALSHRSKQEQRSIAHDTIEMLNEKASKRSRQNLQRIAASHEQLSPTASLCLKEF